MLLKNNDYSIVMPKEPVDAGVFMTREVSEYLKVTERKIYRLAAVKVDPRIQGRWGLALVLNTDRLMDMTAV